MKYEVLLTRNTTESLIIEVEAESKNGAAVRALGKSRDATGWAPNDNYPEPAYLGSGVEDDVVACDDLIAPQTDPRSLYVSEADDPTQCNEMTARDWIERAKETLDARTRAEDDTQLIDAHDDLCHALDILEATK